MNKYNPTKKSEVAAPLIWSGWKAVDKQEVPVQHIRDTVELRLNGSIVSPKRPSKRDLHRQAIQERRGK